jgi:pyruvate kinase
MTKTKIICTIGPAVHSFEKIMQLIQAGMDVARLNFSHGTHEEYIETIKLLKKARKESGRPLGIMLDTKGPEIRLGKVRKSGVELHIGQRIELVKDTVEGNEKRVSVVPAFVLDSLPKGTRVLIDNGYISSHVVETTENGVLIEIDNIGHIYSSKGVNIPNVELALPSLTDTDREDILFGCKHGIDIVAVSFVRSADAILDIKKILSEEKCQDVQVIAKIENNEGVHNFDSILQVSDGIMIARGDLGVEVPLSQVPRLQKMMIRKCYIVGKPSITATQMLESMIQNPRPTRAEASDVANAIHDSTSAVMLSGETAIGKYPLEAVKIMKSIIADAEQDFNYGTFFEQHSKLLYHDVPSAVTLATVKTAYSLRAKAIFTFTHGGVTARLLSRLRPKIPIVALTPNAKVYEQLSLSWGVIPVLCQDCKTIDEAFKEASNFAMTNHIVSYGDLVVLTAGAPFWVSGTTNTILVESIGDVLVRGHGGYGKRIHGNIALVPTAESKKPYAVKDQIIVISSCDERYAPLAREAAGIILQNHIDDHESEKEAHLIAKTLQKPLITRADGAFRILREGQLVSLDPDKALVYKGVVS